MNQAFKNPNAWNEFYEKAWDARREIMKSIIDTGESNPLRVINTFASISRFSIEHMPNGADSDFIFEKDKHYRHDDVINVTDNGEEHSIQTHDIGILPTGLAVDVIINHKNQEQLASSYTSCNHTEFIADYCRGKNFDAIIELGSGYSQNLIKIFNQGGPNIPYYGGEFTESGTLCAQMLADLTNEFELIPFRFDYRFPDFSNIPKYKNVLVFTCHSIEQVTYIPETLIPEISKIADNVTCIHIEPFGFQMVSEKDQSEVDKKHRAYFKLKHWNQNLANLLVRHQISGEISLKYIAKNVFGGIDSNPSSLALWKSV